MKMVFREFKSDPLVASMNLGQMDQTSSDERESYSTIEDVEAQVRLAREEAWRDGFEAGKSQAQTESDHATNLRIEKEIAALTAAIQTRLATEEKIGRETEEEWAVLTLEIAEKFVPEFLSQYSFEGVSHSIREALKITKSTPSLLITISPETEAHLGDKLRVLASQESRERKLEICVHSSLGAGQMNAIWKHGSLSYDLDATCQSLLEILRSAVNTQKTNNKKGNLNGNA